MPVIFKHGNIRFHFFSNEGNPREAVHVHAESADGKAKLWLYPDVTIARSAGYNRRQLAEFVAVVTVRRAEIERAWNEHFN